MAEKIDAHKAHMMLAEPWCSRWRLRSSLRSDCHMRTAEGGSHPKEAERWWLSCQLLTAERE